MEPPEPPQQDYPRGLWAAALGAETTSRSDMRTPTQGTFRSISSPCGASFMWPVRSRPARSQKCRPFIHMNRPLTS